jgi:alpha-tubulin suppressor-like RCC1 family protein
MKTKPTLTTNQPMNTAFFTFRTAAPLLFSLLLMPSWQGLFAQFYRGHSLYVCQSGSVRGFGYNDGTCQVGSGNPTPVSYTTPFTVINNTNAVAVAIGLRHSLSLLDDGTVLAWGNNANGCTGQVYPTYPITCTPTVVPLPGCAVAISAGVNFSMALLADSTVWAWGSDNVGQLGNGVGVSTTNVPVQVAGITTATAISAGAEHAMVLLADSTVWSWGIGSSGQLGNGFTTTNFAPVQVLTATATPLTKVIQIDAGSYHNVILKNDNTVWTWGNNIDGQLGIGSYTQANFAQYSSSIAPGPSTGNNCPLTKP